MLVCLCAAAVCAAASGPRTGGFPATGASADVGGQASREEASHGISDAVPAPIRMVNGIPLALVSSAYSHVKESGAAVAPDERYAKLLFHPSGAAFLLLESGDRKLKAYEGTFSFRRAALNLRFASRGFSLNASFPLDLAAADVTMPFKVFSAGKGASTWQRDGSEDRLLQIVGDLCSAFVRARNADAATTIPLLAKYLEPFVHPAGSPEINVSPAPRILSMTSFKLSEGALGVTVEDQGWGGEIGGDFCSCFARE